MNQKKAKIIRRLARVFVIQTGKQIDTIKYEYKKLKKAYKYSKNGK